jgi:hypothetical protein
MFRHALRPGMLGVTSFPLGKTPRNLIEGHAPLVDMFVSTSLAAGSFRNANCFGRIAMLKSFAAIAFVLVVVLGLSIGAQAQTVIYQDNFSGTGGLNGRTPTIDTGGAAWYVNGGNFTLNGSGGVNLTPNGNAYLPVSLNTPGTYTLSATILV